MWISLLLDKYASLLPTHAICIVHVQISIHIVLRRPFSGLIGLATIPNHHISSPHNACHKKTGNQNTEIPQNIELTQRTIYLDPYCGPICQTSDKVFCHILRLL